MKFELKNFKHFPAFSEETNAFTADLYIDEQKAAYCKNEGHGGCTFITPYNDKNKIVKKAEDYAKGLPEIECTIGNEPFSYAQTLETIVDDLVSKKIEESEIKRLGKKNIVLKLDSDIYTEKLPKKLSMDELLNRPDGIEYLKKRISNLKKEGYTVLNKNIPDEYLNQ